MAVEVLGVGHAPGLVMWLTSARMKSVIRTAVSRLRCWEYTSRNLANRRPKQHIGESPLLPKRSHLNHVGKH